MSTNDPSHMITSLVMTEGVYYYSMCCTIFRSRSLGSRYLLNNFR